jgi:hypothetical protein
VYSDSGDTPSYTCGESTIRSITPSIASAAEDSPLRTALVWSINMIVRLTVSLKVSLAVTTENVIAPSIVELTSISIESLPAGKTLRVPHI